MRQQYHIRHDAEGSRIWDVHGLVRLARDLPVQRALLSDIRELDEPYWFDAHHPTTREIIDHMRLVQQTDLAYPIILCPDGRVMDGMHRVCKAVLEGGTDIAAVRLPTMPEPDYRNVSLDSLPYDDGDGDDDDDDDDGTVAP
ncbi:hypothetical protein ISG32_20220 [Diaphorobacter sp. NR2-3-3-1]|nr:hypothetical protein [Diaphorobacter caeni]